MVDTIIEGRMLADALLDNILDHYEDTDILDVRVRIKKVGHYPEDKDKLKR